MPILKINNRGVTVAHSQTTLDAASLGVEDGDPVRCTRRNSIVANARVPSPMARRPAFVPMPAKRELVAGDD